MSAAMIEDQAELKRRLAALERENRLLKEQARQAERMRDLWQNAVLQLKSTRRELIDAQTELKHSYKTLEQKAANLQHANQMIERLAYSDQQVLENMREAVIVTDAFGNIIEVNPAFEQITGYRRDEVIGKNPRILQSGRQDAEFYRGLWRALCRDGCWQGEIWNQRKSGEIYPAFLSVSPVRNWDGAVVNFIGISLDLEDLKRAQALQQEAEAASRAKSAFLANMSHELRTPLNALLGYAQLLQYDQQLTPRQREAATTIRQSGDYLLRLVNNVLDLAMIDAGQLSLQSQAFNPATMLTGLAETYCARAAAKGLVLSLKTEGLPGLAKSDERRLHQALTSLLDNAVKFTDKGEIRLNASYEQERLLLEVSDTGRGMTAECLQNMCQPFQEASCSTYNAQGTSLGLAICQRLIKKMGGAITVESIPGNGSCFRIELPLASINRDGGDAATIETGLDLCL